MYLKRSDAYANRKCAGAVLRTKNHKITLFVKLFENGEVALGVVNPDAGVDSNGHKQAEYRRVLSPQVGYDD